MGSTFKDAETAAEFQSAACDAILNTARCFDAPPDVLATLAKDGTFLEWAIVSAEAYMKIIPHDARPPNYHEWMQKVEELRTAGETMGEKRNELARLCLEPEDSP